MKIIEFRGLNFLVDGNYYAAETGDYHTNGSCHIFEIDRIEFVVGENTSDFTEFFVNDLEEIETLILEKHYYE